MGDSDSNYDDPPIGGDGGSSGQSSDDGSQQDGIESYSDTKESLPKEEEENEEEVAGVLAGIAGSVASGSASAGVSAGSATSAGAIAGAGSGASGGSDSASDAIGEDKNSSSEIECERPDSSEKEPDQNNQENEDKDRSGDSETPEEEEQVDKDKNESENEEGEEESDDDDSEENDEEDEEDSQAVLVLRADAWSHTAWGAEPALKRVMEVYGDQVEVYYNATPFRKFGDPDEIKRDWETRGDRHQMPIDTSVWDVTPPKSSQLSSRAFEAAVEQGRGAAYLRRLRIAAIVEGTNIENEKTLCSLATDVGMDRTRFEADLEQAEVENDRVPEKLPELLIHIDGRTFRRHGDVHFNDLKMLFDQADLEMENPQPLTGFVYDHGPVTTEEVMEVYQWDRERAVSELTERNNIDRVEIGVGEFWRSS